MAVAPLSSSAVSTATSAACMTSSAANRRLACWVIDGTSPWRAVTHSRADLVEHERPRRPQPRLGAGHGDERGGVVGDRLRGAGPDLGGCERGQLVERAASDAEWHADQRDAREGEEGQAPQRTVVARRLEERTGRQLLGHRHGLGDDVVAAGGRNPITSQ